MLSKYQSDMRPDSKTDLQHIVVEPSAKNHLALDELRVGDANSSFAEVSPQD